jgi:hypothetical protein
VVSLHGQHLPEDKILSKELDRLNQKVASLTGTLNDAKTVQEWTDRTIDGSTLLSPGTDQDVVPYVKARANFKNPPGIPLILSAGVGTFTYLVLGVNEWEMFCFAFGTLFISASSLQPFFWSRSKAGSQQKVLKANLENVVDKWLHERYRLEVHPSTRKKIIRNLLSYDARTFKFKAIGTVTAQMSCTKKGWFVHDIRSADTRIRFQSIDDNLAQFALPKNESYQRVQVSRYTRNVAIEKAQQRVAKDQKIRDGLERAAEYSRNEKVPVRSYQKSSDKEEALLSYQQAQIDDLMYQNHQLTEQLSQPAFNRVEKPIATEKALPTQVVTIVSALEERLNVLTELDLDTESSHVMARIQNEAQNAVDVFKQLQKLNREEQGLTEVLVVLNGLVSDADALLDAEANKLKTKLVVSETFLNATRNSELRLEKPAL